jgi:CDGSH-type Zn-finger protein
MKITVTKDGPYLVTGSVPLSRQTMLPDAEGLSEDWQQGETYPPRAQYRLCRCGQSKHKPFCDDTHLEAQFDGSETANRQEYMQQARTFDGPAMQLTDAEPLCVHARFCTPNGGVWGQVKHSDEPDVRRNFQRQVQNCPSGRLVAWDKASGQPLEPDVPPSIGLVEDPARNCSGPIWVRGGIPVVSADGQAYEVRRRQTLCRCGHSRNKPFCDGSHEPAGFRSDR